MDDVVNDRSTHLCGVIMTYIFTAQLIAYDLCNARVHCAVLCMCVGVREKKGVREREKREREDKEKVSK